MASVAYTAPYATQGSGSQKPPIPSYAAVSSHHPNSGLPGCLSCMHRWEVDCPANMINVGSLQELVDTVEAEQDPASGRLVVVNFFAPECYACKSLQPKLRQIAGNNPDVLFVKVNGLTGDLQAYCESMGITRIPYFHFYRANKRVAEFTANMRPEKLAMLRTEIAAHKPQHIKAADALQYTALEA